MWKAACLAALISACAYSPSFAADLTGKRFDGTYLGTSNGSGAKVCAGFSNPQANRKVVNGQMVWGNGIKAETFDLYADGSFHGRSIEQEVTGKIDGKIMRATGTNVNCVFILELIKQ